MNFSLLYLLHKIYLKEVVSLIFVRNLRVHLININVLLWVRLLNLIGSKQLILVKVVISLAMLKIYLKDLDLMLDTSNIFILIFCIIFL